MMRFVMAAVQKDVRRRLSDPASLLIWIGIPLAIGFLMNLVAGGSTVTPRAKVLIVDQDDTLVSRFLVNSGGGGALRDLLDMETVALDEGQRRIDAGDATALLILPKGLQEAVLLDQPAQLVLVTNPAQRILPAIVEEVLDILVEGAFYAQQLFGPPLRKIAASGGNAPSDADVATVSVEIADRVRRLENVLIPPALILEVRTSGPEAASNLSFGQMFLPGLLFMSVLFIAQGMSADVWEEKTRGTLRRALTAPQPVSRLLAGKLAAGMLFFAVVSLVALLMAVALFDLTWTRVPAALAWCTFSGVALLALMTLLQMAASSERGAHLISTMVVFPLMMLGGSFFPFEAMPPWMAAIGQVTPNGLAVVRLKELLFGEAALGSMLGAAAGIGLPALAAFVLSARRLRGRFAAG